MKKVILALILSILSFPVYSQTGHKVVIGCTASTSAVSGYNIYRSSNGAAFVKLNTNLLTSCGFTDTTVQGGSKYSYALTAVDSSGSESVFSNSASVIVPEAAPSGVTIKVQ